MEIYVLENESEKFADVVVFENAKVVVSWKGDVSSVVVHDNIDNFKAVSVHSGKKLTLLCNM